MNTLQNIYDKLADKTKLAKHEIELGLQDDLKTQFNKYFSVYNIDLLEVGIIDAVKKLNANYVVTAKEFDAFNKIYLVFEKKAIELGVEIPKDITQYKSEVFRFMKLATEQHKKYLNIKL